MAMATALLWVMLVTPAVIVVQARNVKQLIAYAMAFLQPVTRQALWI